MRKRSATICLLLAWLCANGAVSDMAQIFAWSRMFAGYVSTLSITESLTATFDASKPCDICVVVRKTRPADDSQPRAAEFSSEKLFLVCATPATSTHFTPPAGNWPVPTDCTSAARTEPVPVPPPRA